MRDIINATLGADHFLKCQTFSIARNGEGLTPCLSVTIPENLCKYWAYIDFKTPTGKTFKTPRINVIEGKIEYNIPGAVLDAEGKLEVQIVFQNENSEIWKSYVKEFAVRYSINAVDDIVENEDFVSEVQKAIDSIDGKADREELGGKEDTNNKETNLMQDALPDHTKYPSALAVQSFVNSALSGVNQRVNDTQEMAMSIAKTKADKTELDNKVDKEEGKTLYRGMELIYQHTVTEEDVNVEEGKATNLKITLDKDDKPFTLDEIHVHIYTAIEQPETTPKNISVICNNTGNSSNYWLTTTMNKGKRTIQGYGKRLYQNRWFTLFQPSTSALYNQAFNGSYSMSNVDFVTWFYVSNIHQLPVGSTITISGRRVD